MPRVEAEPLTTIQLRLFDSDLAKLRELYGQSFGVNKAIRSMIRTYLRHIEAKAQAEVDALPPLQLPDGSSLQSETI